MAELDASAAPALAPSLAPPESQIKGGTAWLSILCSYSTACVEADAAKNVWLGNQTIQQLYVDVSRVEWRYFSEWAELCWLARANVSTLRLQAGWPRSTQLFAPVPPHSGHKHWKSSISLTWITALHTRPKILLIFNALLSGLKASHIEEACNRVCVPLRGSVATTWAEFWTKSVFFPDYEINKQTWVFLWLAALIFPLNRVRRRTPHFIYLFLFFCQWQVPL